MKGEKTLQILESIGAATIDILDLFAAFLTAGYGASRRKIEYEASKRQKQRWQNQIKKEKECKKKLTEKQQRQRFYEMIYRLKRDGLIKKSMQDDKAFIQLTIKGLKHIEILKDRKENSLPNVNYSNNKGGQFIIITFDIPETERRKRNWLRSVLKNLGFQFVQKSVWIGKVKIPIDFLNKLKELNLTNFVEIFEISKTGTLKQII